MSARTVVGEIGVRARHAPMLARLVPHELRIYEDESEFGSNDGGQRFAAAEGWLEVFANKVTILVGEADDPGSLDSSRPEEPPRGRRAAAQRGRGGLRRSTRPPSMDKARAEAFLEIAER